LAANCAPNISVFSWTVTLSGEENNYKIEYSGDAGATWSSAINAGGAGAFNFTTPRNLDSGNVFSYPLLVRWDSDHSSVSQPVNSNVSLCEQTTPTVTTTCSGPGGPNGTGSVTFKGLTVGEYLNIEDQGAQLITSTTFTQSGLPVSTGNTWDEQIGNGGEADVVVAHGTFVVSACVVTTPTPTPTPRSTPIPGPPVPITGANDTGLSTGQLVLGGGLAIVALALFGMAIRSRRREDI
jgi:hypothetical protein